MSIAWDESAKELNAEPIMRRLLAVLFSIAPFVAGAIAALGVRHDVRMLWMAVASTLVARLVFAVLVRRSTPIAAIVSFTAATVAACDVAISFGARGVFGVVAVAVVLAGFATVGAVLNRPDTVSA
jgi:hypothetical protein